jgi:hypothetical protein
MNRRHKTVLAIALAISANTSAENPTKSPSLSETLEWMKSSLGPTGIVQSDRNGYNKYEAVPGKTSYTEIIKSFSYDSCRVKVVKVAETVNPLVGDYMAQYADEFTLSDFDPDTVKTNTGDGNLRGHIVVFSTINDKKMIHCSSITLNGKDAGQPSECVPALDDTEQLRFSSTEYTERFAKALRHAIKLCGGKPSAF